MLTQLIEAKAEDEQPFHLPAHQAVGDTLPAQHRDLAGVIIERSFERIQRRRRGSRGERTCGRDVIIAAGPRDALQRSFEPLRQRLGNRLGGCASDDHQIVAQPGQSPRQRPEMGLRNETNQALAFGFGDDILECRYAPAGRILEYYGSRPRRFSGWNLA